MVCEIETGAEIGNRDRGHSERLTDNPVGDRVKAVQFCWGQSEGCGLPVRCSECAEQGSVIQHLAPGSQMNKTSPSAVLLIELQAQKENKGDQVFALVHSVCTVLAGSSAGPGSIPLGLVDPAAVSASRDCGRRDLGSCLDNNNFACPCPARVNLGKAGSESLTCLTIA